MTDIFPTNGTGIVPARDAMVIDIDEITLLERISDLRDVKISDQEIRDKFFAGKG